MCGINVSSRILMTVAHMFRSDASLYSLPKTNVTTFNV